MLDIKNITHDEYLSSFKIYDTYEQARSPGFEAHHIIPVSIQKRENDGKIFDNRCVRVTSFEHTVLHYLLARDKQGYYLNIFANFVDGNFYKLSDLEKLTIQNLEDFGTLREKALKDRAEVLRSYNVNRVVSEETKRKISEANKGRKRSEEFKERMRHPHLYSLGDNNVSKRPEVREKISKALSGRKGTAWTDERKKQHSECIKSKWQSGEMHPTGKPSWNKGKKLPPLTTEQRSQISSTLKTMGEEYRRAKESGEFTGTWNQFLSLNKKH